MKSLKQQEQLVIIGGGPAGMMAAISARRHHGTSLGITIIDRTFALGRKILVCGAGRCNITNKNLLNKYQESYYGAYPKFINTVFSEFGYNQIVEFFADLGVEVYLERKTEIGKMFPVTNQAKTISDMLLDEIERSNIEIKLNTHVESIEKDAASGKFLIHTQPVENNAANEDAISQKSQTFQADKVIISAGGKTYPALGADGSGYDLAHTLGHSIVKPVPSALPLEASDELIHLLQGVKFPIEVTSIIEGKAIKTRTDDVMFTNYGLSGPAILNISREISIHFNREQKHDAEVKLNFFPGMTPNQVKELLEARWQKRPNQTLENSLVGIFPTKIPNALLQAADIEPATKVSKLDGQTIEKLIKTLTGYLISISGTRGWNEGEFTAGGVDARQIKSGSLESKILPGLYFAGEIVDVDGDVGGFNLSWSWASGYVAGQLK